MAKTPDSSGTAHCGACGGNSFVVEARTAQHTTQSGSPVSFMYETTKCEKCGEEFLSYEQSLAHSRSLTAAAREADGLFSPGRILRTRLRLGLSQPKFEDALGVGRKTVVRWERGTVPPSSAANGLLWFAEKYPGAFMQYARERAMAESGSGEIKRMIETMIEAPTGEGGIASVIADAKVSTLKGTVTSK